MTVTKAYDALAAEKAAREVEGIFDPTPEQAAMLKRRKALKDRAAKIAAEMQAIENAIEKEMAENGIRALNVDGKNLVNFIPVTKGETVVRVDEFREAFPEVVAMHDEYVTHLPDFTTTHRVPNGFRVTYL